MTAQNFREQAWRKLGGRWGTMALVTLVYSVIVGGVGALSLGLAALLLTGPLQAGYYGVSLKLVRVGNVQIEDLFQRFRRFVDYFLASLLISVFTALWSLLFIIPGIVKGISYSMTYYIMIDHPELTPDQARKQSMVLMNGYKWKYFCLLCSFIGWWILCALTFGILSFWITPYQQTACALFYQNILHEKGMV